MQKRYEQSRPDSCLNKARDTELMFVLLERDIAAPDAIRFWADRRIALGRNKPDDEQIHEALALANNMDYARMHTPKHLKGTL